MWDSLRGNAYGIYLVHYAFVTWLQYALLHAPLAAMVKAALVFIGTHVEAVAGQCILPDVPPETVPDVG